MINTGKLAGKTIFITGASRGIGKAIALKAARDGANIVVAAKTAEPHPKLPGTIYTTCEEIEKAGGKGLPCIVDVRDEKAVRSAVEAAVQKFGGIDILINNASAISLTPTADTDMKRYDLMQNINTRGTFLTSKECLPYLKKSSCAHILTMSPPLNLNPQWFANHVAYTIAKYGMSMCVLGMSEELKPHNIGVNALWPRTAVHTAAMEMLAGEASFKYSRKPEIMADAAYAIMCRDPAKTTGNFFIDDEVLAAEGITDIDQYANDPAHKHELITDLYVGGGAQNIEHFINPAGKTDKPTAGSGGAPPAGKVANVFKTIEATLSEDLVKSTQAVYAFHVTGEEAGNWYVDLKTGSGKCGFGEPPNEADAILKMDAKNFFDMFSGKIKPTAAYMMGKLKISGNLGKAMKLEKLMGKLKSKM